MKNYTYIGDLYQCFQGVARLYQTEKENLKKFAQLKQTRHRVSFWNFRIFWNKVNTSLAWKPNRLFKDVVGLNMIMRLIFNLIQILIQKLILSLLENILMSIHNLGDWHKLSSLAFETQIIRNVYMTVSFHLYMNCVYMVCLHVFLCVWVYTLKPGSHLWD